MKSNFSSRRVKLKDDMELFVHSWLPVDTDKPRAVCVIYHGFLAHGQYPTVRYVAELFAKNGYAVIAPDLPGHGHSPGLPGYLPSVEHLVDCGCKIVDYANLQYPECKIFVVGSSMGGTIALAVARELGVLLSGVIMLAPMLRLSVSAPSRSLLWNLSKVMSKAQIIPSSSTSSEKQYRDPDKRRECDQDPFKPSWPMIRVGSASTCVELAASIQEEFETVKRPFFLAIADEDKVVDNQGAFDLYERAASQDKTLKRYPALHGLLCEPPPLVNDIQRDIMDWINKRS